MAEPVYSMWLCECGLLNWMGDSVCVQCGGAKAETWVSQDRSNHLTLRVLDPKSDTFSDVEFVVLPEKPALVVLVRLAHEHGPSNDPDSVSSNSRQELKQRLGSVANGDPNAERADSHVLRRRPSGLESGDA